MKTETVVVVGAVVGIGILAVVLNKKESGPSGPKFAVGEILWKSHYYVTEPFRVRVLEIDISTGVYASVSYIVEGVDTYYSAIIQEEHLSREWRAVTPEWETS